MESVLCSEHRISVVDHRHAARPLLSWPNMLPGPPAFLTLVSHGGAPARARQALTAAGVELVHVADRAGISMLHQFGAPIMGCGGVQCLTTTQRRRDGRSMAPASWCPPYQCAPPLARAPASQPVDGYVTAAADTLDPRQRPADVDCGCGGACVWQRRRGRAAAAADGRLWCAPVLPATPATDRAGDLFVARGAMRHSSPPGGINPDHEHGWSPPAHSASHGQQRATRSGM